MTHSGLTGNITFDENGDRQVDFVLLDLDPVDNVYKVSHFWNLNQIKFFISLRWWPSTTASPPPLKQSAQSTGPTGGEIVLGSNCKRNSFWLIIMSQRLGRWKGETKQVKHGKSSQTLAIKNSKDLQMFDRTGPPPDVPECGFDGSLCEKDSQVTDYLIGRLRIPIPILVTGSC